jgi:hypothetical protein
VRGGALQSPMPRVGRGVSGDRCSLLNVCRVVWSLARPALMGVPFCVVRNNTDGTLPLDAIKASIKADNVHYPVSRLVALENTQNRYAPLPDCPTAAATPSHDLPFASTCQYVSLSLLSPSLIGCLLCLLCLLCFLRGAALCVAGCG